MAATHPTKEGAPSLPMRPSVRPSIHPELASCLSKALTKTPHPGWPCTVTVLRARSPGAREGRGGQQAGEGTQ